MDMWKLEKKRMQTGGEKWIEQKEGVIPAETLSKPETTTQPRSSLYAFFSRSYVM